MVIINNNIEDLHPGPMSVEPKALGRNSEARKTNPLLDTTGRPSEVAHNRTIGDREVNRI